MRRSEKVAMPSTALTVDVPIRVEPAVPVPDVIETVTVALESVYVLSSMSWITTTGWMDRSLPAVPLPGWVVRPSLTGVLSAVAVILLDTHDSLPSPSYADIAE